MHFNIWLSIENQVPKFAINDTKLYVPFVNLSTQENVKLLDHLKLAFERTINWNKYQSKVSIQTQNQYLDYLIDPRFQGVNRLFVLSFGNNADSTRYNRYFLPTVTIKDYIVMIDGKHFFDQPVINDRRTYDNVRKIVTGQGDDYTTSFPLHYVDFKHCYKMIAIDLSKQQALDADPKAIQ